MAIGYIARAKVNLCLDILGRYADGYHEIASVMQSLAVGDDIFLEAAAGLTLTVVGEPVPEGEANLVVRAARRLAEVTGYRGGAVITLVKRIPVAAGLGGGSADAAATLVGLNELWGLGCDAAFLAALGAEIGADIPFCLTGGTALVTGRGERIRRLPALPELGVLLLKPPYGISTGEAYRDYDLLAPQGEPVAAAMAAALERGAWREALGYCSNTFEAVIFRKHAELARLKRELREAGALAALMSGSGPTLYGLFPSVEAASQAAQFLGRRDLRVIVTATAAAGLERREESPRGAG
ncbi:4-(cytidine 5'-diphospho)-2-C-methyl-D-erythritol kinase [Thermodesulfitimonas sp.]